MDVVETGGIYVVMLNWLNWSPDHLRKRNVFGISAEGDTLWQIGEPPFSLQPCDRAAYTHIGVKEGKLIGGCSVGYDVIIDPKTGSVEMIPPKGRLW